MTPRSRKPVMLLTALGNGDKQQNPCFAEQTEAGLDQDQDEVMVSKQLEPPALHSEDATSLGGYADILRRQYINGTMMSSRQCSSSSSNSNSTELVTEPSMEGKPLSALTSDFK